MSPLRFLNLFLAFALLACLPATPQMKVLDSPSPVEIDELATPTPTRAATATVALPPSPTAPLTSTSPPITVLLFTGVIVPARCVQASIDASGNADYLYDEVRTVIHNADLAVGTFNATMSDYPPHTGCVPTYVLVGSPQNADALQHAGFDIMSVATNHIKDCGLTTCGDRAFLDTLANLKRVGILAVGAGLNLTEAIQPVVATVNGVRFGFVSLGQIEQGGVYAASDRAGIAVLTPDYVKAAVEMARKVSDVVIVMPHWGPENVSKPNWIQRNLAHQIAEAGPDLVVGNHTHVVQGIQMIGSVAVFYGLGNFVFDQWRIENKQGVILKVMFEGVRYMGYELIPTHVDGDGRVHLAGEEEAAEILERIQQASQGLQ